MLRVLREWVLARSAPASPLARACALHLLCRDDGSLHDAGMIVLAGLGACTVVVLVGMGVRVLRKRALVRSTPASPLAHACALHVHLL